MPSGSGSGGPEGWDFNFDLGGADLGGMFNAMMDRYLQGADLSLQDMRQMPRRNRRAFDLYERGQKADLSRDAWEREQQEEQNARMERMQRMAMQDARRQEALALAESQRGRFEDADLKAATISRYGTPGAGGPLGWMQYGSSGVAGRPVWEQQHGRMMGGR